MTTKEELEILEKEVKEEKENSEKTDDEYIYHIMGPTFYLSKGNEWQ